MADSKADEQQQQQQKAQAKNEAQNAIVPYRRALEQAAGSFAMAIPTTMKSVLTADRLSKIMLSSMSRTPLLFKCTPQSVVLFCAHAASMGLEPNSPLGHMYAVPFWNKNALDGKGAYEVVGVVGYRGFIALARRSGLLSNVHARVVHEHDDFDIEFGLDPKLRHRPVLRGEPGDPIAAYCVAEFVDGGKQYGVMTYQEIEAIRARSKSKNGGAWDTDWEEMAKKSVIRREAKMWPLSTEMAHALAVDNAADGGEPAPLPDNMIFDATLERNDEQEQPKEKPKAGDRLAAQLGPKREQQSMLADAKPQVEAQPVEKPKTEQQQTNGSARKVREPGEDG